MSKKNTVVSGKLKEALGILLVLLAAGAVLCGILLISRCERKEPVHEAKKAYNKVTDTETGIVYIECPEGIGPETVGDVYMECEDEGEKLKFHKIAHQEPTEYIAIKTSKGATVYRAESLAAPTISSFKPVGARITLKGSTYPIDAFYSAEQAENNSDVEDESEYIELIVEALKGKTAKATGAWSKEENVNFEIWMYSKDLPGLYYKVDFMVDVNGAEFLYDRVADKLYSAPKKLVARMIS